MGAAHRILFVDDEVSILDGLQNLLHKQRHLWHMVFSQSGEAALAEGKVEEARRTLMQALEHDRTSALTWCGLARAAELSGQTRGALQLCLKALKIDNNAVDAWLEGIHVLEALGFRENAASWLQKASSLFPEHPGLLERMTRLQGQSSRVVSQS